MSIKSFVVVLVLAILMFATMIFGYNQGVIAECGEMVNSCAGNVGGLIGSLIMGFTWIILLGIYIFVIGEAPETGGKQ